MHLICRRKFWLLAVLTSVGLCAAGSCSKTDDIPAEAKTSAPSRSVTFNRDVAPIIFGKCAACHRPGEAAPFSLLTYDDVRRRGSQIAEVTRRGFMPPWPPHEDFGDVAGNRRLSEEEIETLAAWTASDMQEGDAADLPAPPKFAEGWQLGPPDLVLESPAYVLAAAGGDRFRNFVIPVELAAPQWVEAIELRPTNPRVTHHARLGIDGSYESVRRDAEDPEPGYEGMAWGEDPDGQLVVWAPGMMAHGGVPGARWRLQPKTCLVLHTHLQPSGKQEEVRFRIGLHFAKGPPTVRPMILRVGSRAIDIPAGAAHHLVVDKYVLPVAIDIHSIFPHAHSLCREIRVLAVQPDGTEQPLLRIEKFDEQWHDQYRYVKPVRVPRGATIISEFTYDNTDANERNRRHPPERTVYGSNAADEMQDVYLQVTTVRADERAALLEDFQHRETQSKLIGYGKTLEAYPQDPWAREGLAASYLALGQPQEAIRLLEERLKLGPTAIHSSAILGMANLAGGDAARAEELQRQVIEKDAAYPFAWLGLGRALAAQQRLEEADEAFRRAIELAPGLTEAQLERANLLLKQGKLEEAATACEAAIASAPDSPNALLKLAEIRCRQANYDGGLRLLELAQRLAPYTHPPKVLLAVYCFQNGENDQAHKLLNEAHAAQPDHPVPALFLGQLARKDGRLEDARRFLEQAATLRIPDNWPASHRKRFVMLLELERSQLHGERQTP